MGVKQLYSQEASIDRVTELKKLNRSLITQFLELLDALVKRPEEVKKYDTNTKKKKLTNVNSLVVTLKISVRYSSTCIIS
jgi:hypothetical protein